MVNLRDLHQYARPPRLDMGRIPHRFPPPVAMAIALQLDARVDPPLE
jgi:hypothetical protein